MRSIAALQSTCNTLERGLTAKLKSMKTGRDPSNVKVTEAIFETFDGPRVELGKVKLEESANGNQTAFIDNAEKKITISRS